MITWAGAKLAGAAIGKVLRAIPWQVYLAAAILAAGWYHGERRYDAGVADERARHKEAQRRADESARQARQRSATAATATNQASDKRAAQASTETRTTTATAVERVHHEARAVPIPAGCPTSLPDRVRDEGRAAVDRARAAGDPLRKGRDP